MLNLRITSKIWCTPIRHLSRYRILSPSQIIVEKKSRNYSTKTTINASSNLVTSNTTSIQQKESIENLNETLINKNSKQKSEKPCSSCGIKLDEQPETPGYYIPSKSRDITSNLETQLSKTREDILLKQYQQLEGLPIESFSESVKPSSSFKPVLCQRCVNALYHNVFDDKNQKFETSSEVLSHIPKNAHIAYVVSALDFPLSINKEVFKHRNAENILFIITKADAFFTEKGSVEKSALPYFRDSLLQLFGANPDNVMIVSGKLGWNTERILDRLPSGSVYFVGEVNAGKSTLVSKLMYNSDRIVKTKGPGVSHFPNFTRRNQKFVLKSAGTTIVDTPGFSSKNNGVFKYILPDMFKKVVETKVYADSGVGGHRPKPLKVKSKKLFNGARVFSVGGFFYLKPPNGSNIMVLQAMRGEQAIYSSLERAKELSFERPIEIGERFNVTHDAITNLKRYVIPPFYGHIDLVIRGIGFVSICPTGKLKSGGDLFQVYVPEGVDVIVRDTMLSYIYRIKTISENQKGKRRRNIIASRPVPNDKLIFTKLCEVPMDISDQDAFAIVRPPSLFEEEEQSSSKTDYKNTYWRKPDFN